MTGLPKSIIKKYGVTKRAWKVFRGRKSKYRKSKAVSRKTPKKKYKQVKKRMVNKKKIYRKSKQILSGDTGKIIASFAWGAIRPWISKAISPVAARMPFGRYNNNIIIGSSAMLMKRAGIPIVTKIAGAAMQNEAFLAGHKSTEGFGQTSSTNGGI